MAKRSTHTLTCCKFGVEDGSVESGDHTVDIKILLVQEGSDVYRIPLDLETARQIATKLQVVVPSQGLMAIPGKKALGP